MYHRLVSLWENPEELVLGGVEPDYIFTNNSRMPVADNFLESMMAMDMLSYLPDDILVKVDRASMANSLEARVPFLDRRVIELAWRLPIDFKLRNGESKYVLKQVLFNYVPRELIERPKKGFSVPMNQWLKGPLKELCMDLLDPARIESQGLLDSGMTSVLLKEHFSGKRNWADRLWAILVFQMWYEEYFTV
jgi:asparagine synthase (glutamine-hydrolysing)